MTAACRQDDGCADGQFGLAVAIIFQDGIICANLDISKARRSVLDEFIRELGKYLQSVCYPIFQLDLQFCVMAVGVVVSVSVGSTRKHSGTSSGK